MEAHVAISEQLARLKVLAPAGYAIALHVRFTTPTYLFQTYPKEWIDYYSQNGLVMRDPTVLWGFENTGSIRWADLLAVDSDGIIAKAATHGMRFGFTHAIDVGGSRSLSSFTCGNSDFTDAEIAEIDLLVDSLHRQTAGAKSLPNDVREALKGLSIRFTHP